MSSVVRPNKIGIHSSSDKLAMIRSGKKKKTVTGFKENKNITFSNEKGKFIAVEKEKKFEETGVTKKKRNYIQFESKLGTEKERDLHKIEGARLKGQPQKRQEEIIISKRKRKEYLDNYQYLETKELNKSKPAIVIHQRLGDIIGGVYEETSVQRVRGGSYDRNRGSNSSSSVREVRRGGPSTSAVTATKTKTSVTKVGRRGGAVGAFGTTTTSTREMSTTRGGGQSRTATRSASSTQRY